ncbi:MAG TPA: RsmD family RNA methyltransferase [Polyangiaceae bacterium]|nr:RsmD family RNA methyltransferase [Polyangiaceae bacterium]
MGSAGEEVVIDKLIPDGKALGRLTDGRVVIASGPLPGDRIALERVKETKGLVTVLEFRQVEPSSQRVAPSCPHAERCGGCDWMALPIAEQRRQKLEILREALLRTGKIDWRERPLELVAGEHAEGYRGRVRLQIGAGRVGFYHRASHELVEPDVCAVSTPRVNAALREIRELSRHHASALDAFAWLEVREASDGSVSILLEPVAGVPARARSAAWLEALRVHHVVAVRGEEAPRQQWQRFDLTDDAFMLSAPAGFVQVNWEVNRRLIGEVVAGAAQRAVGTFLDAYAGSGNFSLPLLARGLRGLAVESNASAVAPLVEAVRRQGFDAELVVADAAAHARVLARAGRSFDLVLVDPPRAGLGAGLEPLAGLARHWFSMCSCNPVTLARDLRRLLDLGFELEALRAFDMFPQTHHVEALAWLRAPGQGRAQAKPRV